MENVKDVKCNRCNSINNFKIVEKGNQKTAYCNICGRYIKNIAYQKPTLYFGKYKGTTIEDMNSKEQNNYLKWLLGSGAKLGSSLREAIEDKIKFAEFDSKDEPF